jgi:pilus assembly protein FimV
MLVALLQNNPNAFIGGNVNRMRAGVVLNLPDEQQAAAVDAASARRTIAAQSQDFNEFRRRLAGAVPNAPTGTPGRESSGQVQTEVQDKRPAAPAPDRLTLSKGAVTGKEASIADQRARQDNSTRTAELSRNIEELSKLQQGTQAASAPPSPAPAPAPVAEPTPPVGPAVTAPAPAAPPAAPAAEPPKPEASPPPAKPPAPPAPEEPGLLQSLLDNPLALPAGGGLIALLGVLALLKRRRDKAPAQAEDGTPGGESFFNASGGHQVDTEEAPAGAASSMMYSPSQLDAAGDVDPVAEADVYLAYGRDAQAEEILREAARLHPERIAVHGKLLEIYAKRGDKAAMEAVASEIYALSGGAGDDWEHACRVAHPVDPDNPLYRLQGASARPQPTVSMPLEASEPEGEVASAPADTDSGLDLDLSFDDPAAQAPAAADGGLPALELPTVAELSAAATPDAPPAAEPPPADDGVAVDFDLDLSPPPADPPPPAAAPAADEDMGLDFELDLGENVASAAEPAPADVTTGTEVQSMDLDTFNALANEAPAPAPAAPAMDLADFNLDLDLGTPAAAASTSLPDIADPLETKLSLAEEFQAIGDTEGARSLAEEVRDEASGELKARAEAFLSSLT